MKYCCVVVILLAGIFGGNFLYAKDLWKFPAAWKQLDKKMTTEQVATLLGEPLDKETVEPFEVWYYHEAPQRTDGRITWRPKNGFVRFKKVAVNGQDVPLLFDWKQPLWRNVSMPVLEPNTPTTPAETPAPAESAKDDGVKIEVNPQPTPPPSPEPAPAPTPQPKQETTWQDFPGAAINWLKALPKIWLIIGGGFIAFIIFAILKPDPRYKTQKKKKQDNSR